MWSVSVNGNLNSNLASFLSGDASSQDFNDIVFTGLYSINGAWTNGFTESDSYGNMLVISGSLVMHQIAFIGNSTIYMRRKAYGTWNDWKLFSGSDLS